MPQGNVNVGGLMKEAEALLKIKEETRDKLGATRDLLRLAVKAGEATEDQAAWIDDTFNRSRD